MTSNEEGNDPTLSLAGLADDVAELRRQVSTLLPLNSKNPDRSYWQRGEKCGFSDPFSGLDFVVSKLLIVHYFVSCCLFALFSYDSLLLFLYSL